MRRLSYALAVVLPLSLAGCTMLKQMAASSFKLPTLAFKDARLSEVSLAGATVDLVFDLENPNDQGLSLAQTDYLLKVEGKQLAGGNPPQGIKIPGKGKAEVVLPATIRFAELGQSIAALLSKERVGYEASGHVGVDTPLGLVALPFQKTGQLDLPKMPKISVGSPSVRNLSLTGATLNLPLEISNSNPFPIPLGALFGQLKIDGADVGEVQTKDMGAVPPRGKQTIEIPLKLRYSDAMVAVRALRAGVAKIDFKGELRSGEAKLPVEVHERVDFRGNGQRQARPDARTPDGEKKIPRDEDVEPRGSAGD